MSGIGIGGPRAKMTGVVTVGTVNAGAGAGIAIGAGMKMDAIPATGAMMIMQRKGLVQETGKANGKKAAAAGRIAGICLHRAGMCAAILGGERARAWMKLALPGLCKSAARTRPAS